MVKYPLKRLASVFRLVSDFRQNKTSAINASSDIRFSFATGKNNHNERRKYRWQYAVLWTPFWTSNSFEILLRYSTCYFALSCIPVAISVRGTALLRKTSPLTLSEAASKSMKSSWRGGLHNDSKRLIWSTQEDQKRTRACPLSIKLSRSSLLCSRVICRTQEGYPSWGF